MEIENPNINLHQLNEPQLSEIILDAESIVKKASKHKHSISGGGFYASKFSELQAEANLSYRRLVNKLSNFNDQSIRSSLNDVENFINTFFNPKTTSKERGEIRKKILYLIKTVIDPAMTVQPTYNPSDDLFPLDLVRGTRGYIESVAEQACGSYDQGWYDASAVMSRRLLETLIIETFEAYKIEPKIKNSDGTFYYLSGLIPSLLSEPTWSVGRNARKSLPKLKDLGDQSAHNRRYLARKNDIDILKRDLRITIEELVHLSKLKK